MQAQTAEEAVIAKQGLKIIQFTWCQSQAHYHTDSRNFCIRLGRITAGSATKDIVCQVSSHHKMEDVRRQI
jgi:hypothetical protein